MSVRRRPIALSFPAMRRWRLGRPARQGKGALLHPRPVVKPDGGDAAPGKPHPWGCHNPSVQVEPRRAEHLLQRSH